MRYFVLSADGQRYGPADFGTLQQWAREGRIVDTTMLQEEISGNRVAARDVPGLMPMRPAPTSSANPYSPPPVNTAPPQHGSGGNPYSQNPYGGQTGGSYYRPDTPGYNGAYDPAIQQEINNAWIGGVLGLLVCAPIAIWGLLCAKKAKDAGHPGATGPYILNIVVLCIAVFGICIYGLIAAAAFGAG